MNNSDNLTEHLITIKMNGKIVSFYRDPDNTVRACDGDYCVDLGKASGKMTSELIALLHPFEVVEEESHV